MSITENWGSAIYAQGKKFTEIKAQDEKEFEDIVKQNSKALFGPSTVYFDFKSRVDSQTLGSSIPDGFLFDFRDRENPEFYLVEVELARHDFYKHIFPQITKFFAFFKNDESRSDLVDRLHQFIESNTDRKNEIKQYLGNKEIYKAVKDIIESSQNILLIIDENKPEVGEVMTTYTDTWDKMVTIEILKQYESEGESILQLSPDFEVVAFVEPSTEVAPKERPGAERLQATARYWSFWPMPGGVDRFVPNLLGILEKVDHDRPKTADLQSWLRKELGIGDWARGVLQTCLFQAGLAESDDEGVVLTEVGKEILRSADKDQRRLILSNLLARIWGFKEVMTSLNQQAMALEELHSTLSRMGAKWRTKSNQVRYRLDWLRALRFVDRIGRKYALTDEGKKIANSLEPANL
jgi:hypothetical protein